MNTFEKEMAKEVLLENVAKLVIHLVATFGVMGILMGINGVSVLEGLLEPEIWFVATLLYPLVRFAMIFRGSIIMMCLSFLFAFAGIGTIAMKGFQVPVVIGLVGFTVVCFGYYIYNIVVSAKTLRA